MCGIAGYCDFTKRTEKSVLKSMTDALQYRGPDDEGQFIDEADHAQVGLGHRRLSIIELSPLGHQPYNFEDITLVFNGEIYNFQEIKSTLISEGYSFLSNSDTEVIIKAYHAWGIKCLGKFIGMFSFALLDKAKQKLFLVRDRAGVKPMYYYWKNDLLLFASELKSFHQHPAFQKELDLDSLALYFQYSYIPVPYTIFKNAHKLPPGNYAEINIVTKNIKIETYWDVLDYYNKPKLTISYNEAEREMERLLKSACEYRMVSDVPVGVFLSGGYDSSAVAALLQSGRTERLKTFTIGFEEQKYNEAPFAKKVAEYLGTDHQEQYCTHQEAFSIIHTLPDIYDEPLGDNSIIPTTLVSQLAIKKVKVALSADGGDEIFAGYPKFGMSLKYTQQLPNWLQISLSRGMGLINPDRIPLTRSAFNFSTRYKKMQQIWAKHDPSYAMKIISQFNTDSELQAKMKHPFHKLPTNFDLTTLNSGNDAVNKMLAIDYKTFLIDNNLTKVDRATMSVSLEGREPLLDHRIIEFTAQLPSEFKFNNGQTKFILKNIVHRHIPKEIMDRPKMGFIVPIMNWFKTEMKDMLMEYLSESRLKQDDILNVKEIVAQRDRYLAGDAENVQKLWHILVFQMWKKRWKS